MPVPSSASPAEYQRSATLRNRTFIGLLIAQFLAAFNDQAIHASAMFFAINKKALTQESAISLMPILFFAPWAIFCTLAGYYADRYSKRSSLVLWKFAEIGITGLALLGFILGSEMNRPNLGVAIVLSTVFLMGLHSTFFVPAKYGAMPEILRSDLLSRGNGLLESLSFLATILGTVVGGVLSHYFNDDEYVIGLVLVTLAIIGAGASLMIQYIPPANPQRRYPPYIYQPLVKSLGGLVRSRPLSFALVGIAFFTFMVAFMRAAVYMLGESRIPPWSEQRTSLIVGMTALGIGLGSPLAGWLSGKKVELGLIPIGGIGMIVVICLAAILLNSLSALIACIVLIGFFTGFYLVPMFTQLQHRAPKQMKGEVIATSNFTNVLGAMAASFLFFGLVWVAHKTGLAPRFAQNDIYVNQKLLELGTDPHNRPESVLVASDDPDQSRTSIARKRIPDVWPDFDDTEIANVNLQLLISQRTQVAWNRAQEVKEEGREPGEIRVTISSYLVNDKDKAIEHYYVRLADEPQPRIFDNRELPRYLFLGAAAMTLGVLAILINLLRDLPRRSLWVLKSIRKQRLRVDGIEHLPGHGPVILATNAVTQADIENVHNASDRMVHFLRPGMDTSEAVKWLQHAHVVGVTVTPSESTLLDKICSEFKGELTMLPVMCGDGHVRFGAALPANAPAPVVLEAINRTEQVEDH